MSEEQALQNIEEARVRNPIFKELWEVKDRPHSIRIYKHWRACPWILRICSPIENFILEEILEAHFGFELEKTNLEGSWQRVRNFVGFKTEEELEKFKKILTSLHITYR